MRTEGVPGAGKINLSKTSESTKLASLITLAAGAIAVPQTSEADVIVNDLTASPGHVGSSFSPFFTINNLPGTAQLNFRFVQQGTTSTNYVRAVLASQLAGYVRLKTNASLVVHVPAGFAWNQVGPTQWNYGTIGIANYNAHLPNGYDHQYMLFEFKDSTQGNAMRYGWAEISLFNANISTSEGPDVTIWRYAYENTGVQLATGQTQVPEPSSIGLLALGALTVGAKGLRSWRRAEKAKD